MSDDLDKRLSVHEAICEQRYKNIEESLDNGKARMKHIEWLLYATILAVLFGPGVAATFVKRFLGI
jgi:hypothetical protein